MQQLDVLMWIHGLAAVIWFISALVAYNSYRAFKQFADMGWSGTFVLFGALRLGYAWEALRWSQNLVYLNSELVTTLAESFRLRVQFAAVELVAVLLVLYFFRARRSIV
jgi:hypothetical protein